MSNIGKHARSLAQEWFVKYDILPSGGEALYGDLARELATVWDFEVERFMHEKFPEARPAWNYLPHVQGDKRNIELGAKKP